MIDHTLKLAGIGEAYLYTLAPNYERAYTLYMVFTNKQLLFRTDSIMDLAKFIRDWNTEKGVPDYGTHPHSPSV